MAAKENGTILICHDGSDAADEAIRQAGRIVGEGTAMVVGSRGRGTVGSAVLGSVSHEIVNDFRRPTLVV